MELLLLLLLERPFVIQDTHAMGKSKRSSHYYRLIKFIHYDMVRAAVYRWLAFIRPPLLPHCTALRLGMWQWHHPSWWCFLTAFEFNLVCCCWKRRKQIWLVLQKERNTRLDFPWRPSFLQQSTTDWRERAAMTSRYRSFTHYFSLFQYIQLAHSNRWRKVLFLFCFHQAPAWWSWLNCTERVNDGGGR